MIFTSNLNTLCYSYVWWMWSKRQMGKWPYIEWRCSGVLNKVDHLNFGMSSSNNMQESLCWIRDEIKAPGKIILNTIWKSITPGRLSCNYYALYGISIKISPVWNYESSAGWFPMRDHVELNDLLSLLLFLDISVHDMHPFSSFFWDCSTSLNRFILAID